MRGLTTIIIVDDHPFFRAALHRALEASPGLSIVGDAATGENAIRLAETLQPGSADARQDSESCSPTCFTCAAMIDACVTRIQSSSR